MIRILLLEPKTVYVAEHIPFFCKLVPLATHDISVAANHDACGTFNTSNS